MRRCVYFFASAFFYLLLLTLATVTPTSAQTNTAAGIVIIKSDANGIVLELDTPDYATKTQTLGNQTFLAFDAVGWSNTDIPDKPSLPMRGVMLAIPQNAQPTLEIRADKTRTTTLAAPPMPAPSQRVSYDADPTLPRSEGVAYNPDAVTYSANEFYPAHIAEMNAPAQWRSQRYVRVQFRPFQYNPVTRELLIHQRVRVAIKFNLPAQSQNAEMGQAVDEGAFEPMLANALLNYDSARNWRAARAANASPEAINAGPTGYKIPVSADNIYRVVCSQLTTAGIDITTTDVTTLRLFDDGAEVALRVFDNNGNNRCNGPDYIEFYGRAARSKYTDTNYYWLTFGGAAGKRMTLKPGPASGTARTEFIASLHLEENKQFIGYLPMLEDADHWYWDFVPNTAVSPAVNYRDYSFTLSNLATSATTASLRVAIAGFSQTNHDTRVYVNGTRVHQVAWSGRDARTLDMTFASNLLRSGANTFRVEEGFASPNLIYVNAFDLNYPATFSAVSNLAQIREKVSGTRAYSITGFTTNDAETFDITDPFNVTQLQTTNTASGVTYTASFKDDTAPAREYLVLTVAKRGTPASITLDTTSNLKNSAQGADYILITHSAFKTNAQPLANLRTAQGMRVQLIDVQDVYDEFSDGSLTPQAIRDFLAYAYANWQTPRVAYVLLVGNGNFNFKNYSAYATETNYIPPYMRVVDPWIGEAASDNQLVTFDANSPLPSVAIGRLPALTTSEVDAMVNKIINYESSPPTGTWRNQVTFVTDNAFESSGAADAAGNFFAMSDLVASNVYYVPPPLTVERIYYNPCASCTQPYSTYATSAAARTAVLAAINNGRIIVNYVGHGAIQQWAESLLKNTDAATLTNGSKTPVMLPMTCYEAYFQFPGTASVSEAMLTRASNGAVASWGPTGLGVATGHDLLDRGFFEAVMEHNLKRVGAAAVAGKANLFANSVTNLDLIDTFNLLGDPATQMPVSVTPPTATPTRTNTFTPTRTLTPTATRTNTPTSTRTFTPTSTRTFTLTATNTRTPTPSNTSTNTPTPSNTFTNTPTPTQTLTPTRTFTPTRTLTPSPTLPPTGVTLISMNAQVTNKQRVRVKWETGNELNVVGFNLWRRAGKNDAWEMLNRKLLAAKQIGTINGARYMRGDKTVRAGTRYFYKLEIVRADGTSEWSDIQRVNVK